MIDYTRLTTRAESECRRRAREGRQEVRGGGAPSTAKKETRGWRGGSRYGTAASSSQFLILARKIIRFCFSHSQSMCVCARGRASAGASSGGGAKGRGASSSIFNIPPCMRRAGAGAGGGGGVFYPHLLKTPFPTFYFFSRFSLRLSHFSLTLIRLHIIDFFDEQSTHTLPPGFTYTYNAAQLPPFVIASFF